MKCRVCKCTYERPCEPPCDWHSEDLCTTCAVAARAVALWLVSANRSSGSALLREAKQHVKETPKPLRWKTTTFTKRRKRA